MFPPDFAIYHFGPPPFDLQPPKCRRCGHAHGKKGCFCGCRRFEDEHKGTGHSTKCAKRRSKKGRQ